jgi:Zn finger protein HypA/HybF involved in hydrogenase expression
MNEKDWERRKALQGKYRFLTPTDLMEGLMAFGFECADGWLDILEDLFENINKIVERDNLIEFQVVQVKEKFGRLCVYTRNTHKEIEQLIREAEKKAAVTCEDCGAKGETQEIGHWYRTQCPVCHSKRLAKRMGIEPSGVN